MTPHERIAEIKRLAATPDGAALLQLIGGEASQPQPWTPGESMLPNPVHTAAIPDEQAVQPNTEAFARDLELAGYRPGVVAQGISIGRSIQSLLGLLRIL